MIHAVEMASCSMIHITSVMKTGVGVQAILRFCFRNLRGRNVGITGWMDYEDAVEMD
jgi:hypothetical protein